MDVDAMQLDIALGAVHERFIRGGQRQAVALELGQAKFVSARLAGGLDLFDRAAHPADRAQIAFESFNGSEIGGEGVIAANRRVAWFVGIPWSEVTRGFDLAV